MLFCAGGYTKESPRRSYIRQQQHPREHLHQLSLLEERAAADFLHPEICRFGWFSDWTMCRDCCLVVGWGSDSIIHMSNNISFHYIGSILNDLRFLFSLPQTNPVLFGGHSKRERERSSHSAWITHHNHYLLRPPTLFSHVLILYTYIVLARIGFLVLFLSQTISGFCQY